MCKKKDRIFCKYDNKFPEHCPLEPTSFEQLPSEKKEIARDIYYFVKSKNGEDKLLEYNFNSVMTSYQSMLYVLIDRYNSTHERKATLNDFENAWSVKE